MSTRALIGLENAEGTISVNYCHSDGYIKGGVGEKLLRHYQSLPKIEELIAGGDISQLGWSIEAPEGHSFETPAEGCTVFYMRDRGETNLEPCEYQGDRDFLQEAGDGVYYCYLYDGDWYVAEPRAEEWVLLASKLLEVVANK